MFNRMGHILDADIVRCNKIWFLKVRWEYLGSTIFIVLKRFSKSDFTRTRTGDFHGEHRASRLVLT